VDPAGPGLAGELDDGDAASPIFSHSTGKLGYQASPGMLASGFILILLSLAGSPAEPHTVMMNYETLELCQAAARAAAALGILADCLPQAERPGGIAEPREDSTHTATKPRLERSIPAERRPPHLRPGILTPPPSD
jgi:hypothetical protein